MKLFYTRKYDCERVLANELPDSDKFHYWIETLEDAPMRIDGSVDWLRTQHPRKKVYGLEFVDDKVVLKG